MAEILDELMQHKEKIEILEALADFPQLPAPMTLDLIKHISKMEEAKILTSLKQLIDKNLVAEITEQGKTFYYIRFLGRETLEDIRRIINRLK